MAEPSAGAVANGANSVTSDTPHCRERERKGVRKEDPSIMQLRSTLGDQETGSDGSLSRWRFDDPVLARLDLLFGAAEITHQALVGENLGHFGVGDERAFFHNPSHKIN